MHRRQLLQKAKRIVVKVGTALLTKTTGVLNRPFISKLSREIAALHREGREIVLVTSGAVGSGMLSMGLTARPKSIPVKQALAAIGQPRLMNAYAQAFARHGLKTAQVLLTSEDINHRRRYSNARNALFEILRMGVIPIFNENDTVSVNEIKFGDNDELSAQITHLAEADILIVLTDVEGLYSCDPHQHPQAALLHQVDRITPEIEAMACSSHHDVGTGGMVTKMRAAKKVTAMGEEMVIADGRKPRVLLRLIAGEEVGTIFYPQNDKMAARKRWIAFALRPQGRLLLDAGASRAIASQGRSLLPAGIREVEGKFQQGDCVELVDERGVGFARGLVNYDAEAVLALRGAKSSEIEQRLGYKTTDEIIHRNDLALLR